jgi:hypothetical protein
MMAATSTTVSAATATTSTRVGIGQRVTEAARHQSRCGVFTSLRLFHARGDRQ